MKKSTQNIICCFLKTDASAGSPVMRGIFELITGIRIPNVKKVDMQERRLITAKRTY